MGSALGLELLSKDGLEVIGLRVVLKVGNFEGFANDGFVLGFTEIGFAVGEVVPSAVGLIDGR